MVFCVKVVDPFSKTKCITGKRLADIVTIFFLDNELSQNSLELSKLFKEVCESISQQVKNSSFCADILEKKGILRVVNNIRLLQKEELKKHRKEPYQWSKGLTPGDVIGVKVRVTSKNDGFKVIYTFTYLMSSFVYIINNNRIFSM